MSLRGSYDSIALSLVAGLSRPFIGLMPLPKDREHTPEPLHQNACS